MLDNFFKFKENETNFKTEILAGITTFLEMAYILGVNPVILGDGGLPVTGVFFATAVASGVACIIYGTGCQISCRIGTGYGSECAFYIHNNSWNGKQH